MRFDFIWVFRIVMKYKSKILNDSLGFSLRSQPMGASLPEHHHLQHCEG